MSNIEPEVPINYEAIADQHIAALQTMHESTMLQLGGGLFIGPISRRKLISASVLPDKFLQVVATALDEDPILANARPGAAGKLRTVVPQSGALRKIAEHHEFLARSYRETDTVRRADAGDEAFRIYNIAQSFNRVRDTKELVPRLKAMKEALGARGRRTAEVKKKMAEAKAAKAATAPAVIPKETK